MVTLYVVGSVRDEALFAVLRESTHGNGQRGKVYRRASSSGEVTSISKVEAVDRAFPPIPRIELEHEVQHTPHGGCTR